MVIFCILLNKGLLIFWWKNDIDDIKKEFSLGMQVEGLT